MIEAPLEIQKTLEIPTDHIAACEAIGTPYKGNAAGNTVNLLDLTGQNAPPDPLPEG
jgi:iron transport multicopper oxidase